MIWRAVLACILWGSAFAGAKIGFKYVDPIYLSGLRFTLAGLMLIPVILYKKIDLKAPLKHWRFMLLFAFIQTFLQYGIFFMGLSRVPAAISSIVIGAGPLFIAIMAHFTLKNDKMTMRKMSAIMIGVAGITVISLSKGMSLTADSGFYLGICMLILSNLVGSSTNILVVKKKDYNISPYVLTSFANFTGGIMLLITSMIIEKPEVKIYPAEFYIALVWLAFIPAAASSHWYGILQRPEIG